MRYNKNENSLDEKYYVDLKYVLDIGNYDKMVHNLQQTLITPVNLHHLYIP